jgi:hypothetical protein
MVMAVQYPNASKYANRIFLLTIYIMTCLSHAVMANEKQIRQLSKTIETTMQSAGIPGLAISVAKNGKVLFQTLFFI